MALACPTGSVDGIAKERVRPKQTKIPVLSLTPTTSCRSSAFLSLVLVLLRVLFLFSPDHHLLILLDLSYTVGSAFVVSHIDTLLEESTPLRKDGVYSDLMRVDRSRCGAGKPSLPSTEYGQSMQAMLPFTAQNEEEYGSAHRLWSAWPTSTCWYCFSSW